MDGGHVRLALLTCEQPWQRTLASRLATEHEVSLVVVDRHFGRRARLLRALTLLTRPSRLARKMKERAAVAALEARDAALYRRHFEQEGAPPFERSAGRVTRVRDISGREVARQLADVKPEAIVVSGTRLVRPPVLELHPPLGMLNLHTGLSPYYRGGPCTFWCLYNEEPEYAGVTVHHLTPGIDSGDIILSARAGLEATDDLPSLDARVIDLGHRLLLRALRLLEEDRAPRVPQWEKGRLFLYKEFTPFVRLTLEDKLARGLVERCRRRLRESPPVIRTVEAP